MPSSFHYNSKKVTGWIALYIAGISIALMTGTFLRVQKQEDYLARLLPAHMRGEVPWETISAQEVALGTSIEPHINNIFHLPIDMEQTSMRTLFGRKGPDVRFWGYCFPESKEEADQLVARSRLPGKIFLSEKERMVMHQLQQQEKRESFSVFRNLTKEDLNESRSIRGMIRHQKDIFFAGETCYVMTEEPLPIGIDFDRDSVNARLETKHKTKDTEKDTDGDGINDGVEIFTMKSNPIARDSDADGLVDGIEDANHNGRVDAGETSPLEWDSDRDGLCDGYCIVDYAIRTGFSAPVDFEFDVNDKVVWEDKNLNGVVDGNETDPRLRDTDGDGILDEQEFFACLLTGASDC